MRNALKSLVNNALAHFGVEIKQKTGSIPNPIHLWETDADFLRLYEQTKGHTVVDRVRMFMLYQTFLQATSLAGEVVEVGVYRGGTAKLFSLLASERDLRKNIHLFDTFGGMPVTSSEFDLHKEGDFSDTSIEAVSEYLNDARHVKLSKGFFPQTAVHLRNNIFSFVHIDVDIYQSVRDCCEFLYPRMVVNGIMMFDDYGFVSCPGAKKAVDEFFMDKRETPLYLPSGQCMVVKI